MALQSPSSSSNRFDYDVFLSFRGSDTRYGFTGNLYDALTKRGIRTFMDDKELKGGEEITPAFRKAIEDSRICIPIFSINYAESSFCLDELDHIMSCRDSSKAEEDRLVLPVFYGVEPTHLRHHTGSYHVALDNHEKRFQDNKEKYIHNMERLEKWKMALTRVANLSGRPFNPPTRKTTLIQEANLTDHTFDSTGKMTLNQEANLPDHTFDPAGNVYEYAFIGEIVDFVSNKINHTPLHVAEYRVGLEPRVVQVKSLLNMGSNDGVVMVGIHGSGGIGKTTLAKEIYNSIAHQFKVLCFLDDVRAKTQQHGLVHLQEILLHETLGENDIKLGSVWKGSSMIKKRLHTLKVLLILDDVDKMEQLEVLAGGSDWFGAGSIVIITTRDKQLLTSHGIERMYAVEELNEEEALELLKRKAFKNNIVDSSYEGILNRVVAYASGLPLALEVVGSNLCGKHIANWESTLAQYKRNPHKKIQKILEVSFNALEKDEQSVFLDIACFFNKAGLGEVERILSAHHGYCIKYLIEVLVEKSIIKITEFGVVRLHDLIEDMGKEIVRQQSPKELGKRSRLWLHEDIVQVLENNMGTSKIEIIILDCGSTDVVVDWNGEVFKKMRNLKTLIIRHGYVGRCNFSDGPEHFSNSLRVLDWHGYFLQSIPSILLNKKLKDMTLLSFRNCRYLIDIPDISNLPNLEVLFLVNCESLITIHKSVGFMRKLKILEVEDCFRLMSFPPRIKLPSLQKLKICSCGSLKSFPEILGEMRNITQFELSRTSIKELSSSFQNLTGVCELVISGFGIRLPISILMMPKLSRVEIYGCQLQIDNPNSTISSNIKILKLFNCNLSDDVLAIVLKAVANVEELCISENNITILPECIRECRFLTKLDLSLCADLEEIRALPPNLKILKAGDCILLRSSSYKSMLNQELHEHGGTDFCFPKRIIKGIPEWFEHQSVGNSISFWFRKSVPSIALFFQGDLFARVVCLRINGNEYPLIHSRLHVDWRSSYGTRLLDVQLQDNKKLRSELGEELSRNEWIHAEIAFKQLEMFENLGIQILFLMQIGIHVLEQKTNMDDIRFTDPYERKRKFDE